MDREEQSNKQAHHIQNVEAQKQLKQEQKQMQVKRRGTVSLEQSKGPPEGFYSPEIFVLTIGDGDLSFSLSISQWVNYKFSKNIDRFVATTYDSREELQKLYKLNARTNIKKLQENGVKVIHNIDVNKLNQEQTKNLIDPQGLRFDRVVWNFPHAGFPEKSYGPGFEWEQGFHEKHISIINNFFRHSKLYLKEDGLILMAHKTVEPFSIWNIAGIAQKNKYILKSQLPFNINDYPGYENRRGAGKNGGKRFPIEDAVQYVFILGKKQQVV